jgi:hypothetical protein
LYKTSDGIIQSLNQATATKGNCLCLNWKSSRKVDDIQSDGQTVKRAGSQSPKFMNRNLMNLKRPSCA